MSYNEVPFPRMDRSWGPHEISLLPQIYDPEHPYLCYILVKGQQFFSLPRSISCHRFKDSDFYRYPSLPRRGRIKETVLSPWKEEVDSYRHHISLLYDELQSSVPGPYKAPSIAIARAEDTLFHMTHMMSYRDAVEYTRGLQRFVAEIQAFLLWGNKLLGRSLKHNEPTHPCFRGAYVASSTDYDRLSSDGVPVFYLISTPPSNLPSARYVRVTELTSICEFRRWADVNLTRHQKDVVKGKLVHSKPLMFYPPHVDRSDPLAFERAACGYGPRKDKMFLERRIVQDSLIVSSRGE